MKNTSRKHARNFIHKTSQKRLNESVAVFRDQVQNSLLVNAVEIELYQMCKTVGAMCTCTQRKAMQEQNSEEVTFGFAASNFGSSFAQAMMNDVEDYDENQDTANFAGTSYCGICYKTLRNNGYQRFGAYEVLCNALSTYKTEGYTLNTEEGPHRFERIARGYVQFEIEIPLMFKSASVSVRNNCQLVQCQVQTELGNLNLQYLKDRAGYKGYIRVDADNFTHVVVTFETGNAIKVNMSRETEALSYEELKSVSDITLVAGSDVNNINAGDVIRIPKRNLVLQVRTRDPYQTASREVLSWNIQSRVIQPGDPMRKIGVRHLVD